MKGMQPCNPAIVDLIPTVPERDGHDTEWQCLLDAGRTEVAERRGSRVQQTHSRRVNSDTFAVAMTLMPIPMGW